MVSANKIKRVNNAAQISLKTLGRAAHKTGIKTVAGLTVYALLNNLIDIHSVDYDETQNSL